MSIRDWQSIPLFEKLDGPNQTLFSKVLDYVAPLLNSRPIGGEEFTDHDEEHSRRVLCQIGKILPDSAQLNETELFILALSALLHDFGMWVSAAEAKGFLDEEDFTRFCNDHYDKVWELYRRLAASSDNAELGAADMLLRRLAFFWARRRHADRVAELFASTEENPIRGKISTIIGEKRLQAVAIISAAHGWERDLVLDNKELEPQEISDDLVNLRYLAALLRMGDLLDIGEGRVSSLVWEYLRPLSPESEAHWRKESTLNVVRCEPDRIKIAGTFDIDQGGVTVAEAYNLARDWLDWIKKEIDGCLLLLPSRFADEPRLKKRCALGALKLDTEDVKAKGLVLGEEISFQIDRDRALELLADELYSCSSNFIRELLQNSIDATRAQMLDDIEEHQGKYPDKAFPRNAPWSWPSEVTQDSRYQITVDMTTEKQDGVEYEIVTIRDCGIGITPRQFKEYFLQVGKSYYSSPTSRQKYSFPSISRFGIGFLSCLNVADRIEVTTRARREATGLQFRYRSPSQHFVVIRDDQAGFGTTVTLWINLKRKRPEGWDSPPIKNGPTCCDDLTMRETSHGRLLDAAIQWPMLAETTRVVNGDIHVREWPSQSYELRSKMASTDTEYLPGRQWHPFRVFSPEGRLLAEGSIKSLATCPNGPFFVDNLRNSLIAIRGVVAAKEWRSPEPRDNRDAVLNYYYLPPDSLAPSRTLRRDPTDAILEKVVLALKRHSYAQLRERSVEHAGIWTLYTDQESSAYRHWPWILPYRTKDACGWDSWANLDERFPRFLVVPRGVALEGPWKSEVPCVGWPTVDIQFYEECTLVNTDDRFTSILWPKNTDSRGLRIVDAQVTRVLDSVIFPTDGRIPYRVANISPYDIQRSDLADVCPTYDDDLYFSNPWSDSCCLSGQDRIRSEFFKLPPVDYPTDLLDISIDEGDDWV